MKAALAIVLAVAGVLLVLAACTSDEEQAVTASPTPTGSLTATPTARSSNGNVGPSLTIVPTATPRASIPADWKSLADPFGLSTLRYPPNWFATDGEISSVDPSTWSKSGPPPDSIDVEVAVHKDDGYGCGALKYDPVIGQVSPEANATRAILGGVEGWQVVRRPGDPLLNDPYTLIHAVSAIWKGYCFNIAAYFAQETPDDNLFTSIVSTFNFTS